MDIDANLTLKIRRWFKAIGLNLIGFTDGIKVTVCKEGVYHIFPLWVWSS